VIFADQIRFAFSYYSRLSFTLLGLSAVRESNWNFSIDWLQLLCSWKCRCELRYLTVIRYSEEKKEAEINFEKSVLHEK
jgi:hypothetical protein